MIHRTGKLSLVAANLTATYLPVLPSFYYIGFITLAETYPASRAFSLAWLLAFKQIKLIN